MESTKLRLFGLRIIVLAMVLALGVSPVCALARGAAAADQSRSGHGVSSFTIAQDEGLTVFDLSVTGNVNQYANETNFIVQLVSESSETTVAWLVNEIAIDYSCSVAVRIPTDGNYRVVLTNCTGDWTITARQPRPTTAPATRVWNGSGESVTDPLYLPKGTYKFNGAQDGTRNYIVHLVDLGGNTVEYLANEQGIEPAEKVFVVKKSGVYVLSVDADGTWNMQIAKHYIPFRIYGLTAPKTATRYKRFVVSVKLDPGYIGLSSTPVTMYAQKKSGKKWISKLHAHLHGDFATHTKYSAGLTVSKGTWRVWAQFDDAEHAMKKTGYKYVSVK